MTHSQEPSTCRACGAEVEWFATLNGATMPVDPGHDDAGDVVLVRRLNELQQAELFAIVSPPAADGQLALLDVEPLELDTRERRRSHWSTCTDPESFRS